MIYDDLLNFINIMSIPPKYGHWTRVESPMSRSCVTLRRRATSSVCPRSWAKSGPPSEFWSWDLGGRGNGAKNHGNHGELSDRKKRW